MKIFISIIILLLYSPFAFSQKTKLSKQKQHQITFSQDKSTATIKGNNIVEFNLSIAETLDLNDMIDAVSMKIYKNQNSMLVDFIKYINTSRATKRFIINQKKVNTNLRLDKETLRILQIKSVVEVNKFRKINDLPNLIYHETLQIVAQDYANYCTKNNWKCNHYDMDGNGYGYRVEKLLDGYSSAENISCCCDESPWETVQQFKESPSHLRNLLATNMKYIAVGVSQFPDGTIMYVQNFTYKRFE